MSKETRKKKDAEAQLEASKKAKRNARDRRTALKSLENAADYKSKFMALGSMK